MFSLIALLVWPLVVIVAFVKLKPSVALLVSIIGGYLLLPTRAGFDFPLLPDLDKDSIPIIVAIAAGFFALRRAPEAIGDRVLPGWIPEEPLPRLLLILAFFGGFMTILTNGDAQVFGSTQLPGLRLYDAFSHLLQILIVVLPLIAARRFLATPESHRAVLFALALAGLVYSLPTLFEVRMSPQLNVWIYGFFPHDWSMHVRENGFRPLVFLSHGLWLGIFLACAVLASLACARITSGTYRLFWLASAVWLMGTLFLSKNLGALMITAVLVPVIFLLGTRLQLIAAGIVVAVILVYPALRSADVMPVDAVLSFAADIDPERAASFAVRLDNEEILVAKALERPVFGWGGWGRSRVYDESGRDISITDGYWVIVLGVGGWVHYVAVMGLLGLPLILLALGRRRGIGIETAAMAVILAGNMVDLIPNATATPITWLMAGAIWGRLELARAPAAEAPTSAPEPGVRQVRYSRGPRGTAVSAHQPTYSRQSLPKYRRSTQAR